MKAASWRKRLGARLPPLGSRVRVSVTPCGFRGGGNGVWVGFSRGFSRFLLPQISFHYFSTHTHLIHFVLFHQPLWWCVRRGRPAPLLLTDLYYRGFIASHPSTRPYVGHELRIFIYLSMTNWDQTYFKCKKTIILTSYRFKYLSLKLWGPPLWSGVT